MAAVKRQALFAYTPLRTVSISVSLSSIIGGTGCFGSIVHFRSSSCQTAISVSSSYFGGGGGAGAGIVGYFRTKAAQVVLPLKQNK